MTTTIICFIAYTMFSSEIFLHLVSVPTSYAMYLSIFPIMPLVKKIADKVKFLLTNCTIMGISFYIKLQKAHCTYMYEGAFMSFWPSIQKWQSQPWQFHDFFPLQIQWKYYSSLPVPSYHIHVHKVYANPTGREGVTQNIVGTHACPKKRRKRVSFLI